MEEAEKWYKLFIELAKYYWKGDDNFKSKEPIIEIIDDGKNKVVEIIKENFDLK